LETEVTKLWVEFLQLRFDTGYINFAAKEKLIELGAPESFRWMYVKTAKKPRLNNKSILENLDARIADIENKLKK
jgi:hypothetical protein